MKHLPFTLVIAHVALVAGTRAFGAEAAPPDLRDVEWQLEYRASELPDKTAGWTAHGKGISELKDGSLRLVDESSEPHYFEAKWKPDSSREIAVEARLKVKSVTGSVRNKPSASLWPWRDGAPVVIHVCDGQRQEGLSLSQTQASSFSGRFIPMDTTNRFHTYQLVIRGSDMSIFVDGQQKVKGQGAFWRPADGSPAFLRFGSTAKTATGEAEWEYVRLGVRKPTLPEMKPSVSIEVSPAWEIKRTDTRQTRPYLYNLGDGLLLTSVAQGPDAFYEPYGVLKSTDDGKTWTPIPGLDQVDFAPLPMIRRPDKSVLGVSRWTWMKEGGGITAKIVKFDPTASSYTIYDSEVILPERYRSTKKGDIVIFERHIWNDADGGLTAVLWSRIAVKRPDGRSQTERFSHLMRSTDEGKTWTHLSVIGPGGEPAVVRFDDREQTAIIRGERTSPMIQVFSEDGGRTWSKPIQLEVGKVAPDLELLSNGVLACSYGRPSSCMMFSVDRGKTWSSHHVISERVGFNYSSLREISPGRLLYLHDAPPIQAHYIDVRPAP